MLKPQIQTALILLPGAAGVLEVGGYFTYADAVRMAEDELRSLRFRVIELEQQLKTPDELKAEFELDCAADCDCKR